MLKAIDSFSTKKIMIIGDIIADDYIYGLTSRVSREAPVLILKFDSHTISLGGAGNAVNNVRELGADIIPVGVVGDDYIGNELVSILNKKGINTGTITCLKGKNTTTKTRILAGGLHTTKQQVIRIDKENSSSYDDDTQNEILKNIKDNIDDVDGVIVSDYGYGVLSDTIIDFINDYAKSNDKIISVDSRHNLFRFKNVTTITPNEPEVEEMLHVSLEGNEHIPFAGKKLMDEIKCESVLITRGKKGMVIFEKAREPVNIPIYGSDEVADVTGAGDTVISAFTLGIVSSLPPVSAARMANIAGGIVVMKSGTAVVTTKELKNAVRSSGTGLSDER
jgi:rfaE bifunctional protein kinase chain/domain